jgi:UDP-N-acetylmuramoyl-L-alanyl-D-glutamate--2,6-diaminopimelate ligase
MTNLKISDSKKNNLNMNSGITADSREVKPDYIFVAVKGQTVDGHDYIPQAIRNGAKIIIGEKDIKVPKGIKYIKVKDSREALGKYSSEFYGNPSRKLKVIGITGTKGKTTTAHIIYHILTTAGKKVGLISSIVAKIGDKETDTGFHVTSPDVISLHKFLKQMVDAGCEYAVIEVSSHGIDQKRIAGINFDIGVLTNIAPEHLDYHKTFEEYKRVKMSFINSCKYKVFAPLDTDLDILPGKFNNLNTEAAIKAVEFLGIDRTAAIKTLGTFKLPEGRLEKIDNSKGIKIFIDFAHTPESLEAALKYIRTQTANKLIAVFGCAGERDPFKRPKMGKVSSKLADEVILTAEDPRSENVNDIINQIRSGISSNKAKIYEEPNRKKAIKMALEHAKKGDSVGIFGKGHEKSINLDGVYETPWSDQEVVREYIKILKI